MGKYCQRPIAVMGVVDHLGRILLIGDQLPLRYTDLDNENFKLHTQVAQFLSYTVFFWGQKKSVTQGLTVN